MKSRPLASPLRASGPVLLSAFALLSSASAQTTTLYWGGGSSNLTSGATPIDNQTPPNTLPTVPTPTSVFAGTWNTTTTNWNTSTSASSGWQAWQTGAIAAFKSDSSSQVSGTGTANITLGADFAVAGINSVFSNAAAKSQVFALVGDTSSTDHIITLADNGVINVVSPTANANGFAFGRAGQVSGQGAAILAGNNFTLNGTTALGAFGYNPGASLSILSNSTISGTARINGGLLAVGGINGSTTSAGSLANITNYDLIGSNAILQVTQAGATNAVKDDAVIRLASGQLQLVPVAAGTAFNETVGTIIIEGSGNIGTTARSAGTSPTVASTLNITNGFTRGDNGKGVLVATSLNGTQGLGTTSGLNLNGQGFAANSTAFIAYGLNLGKGYNVAGGTDTTTASSVRFMATDSNGKLGVTDSAAGNATLSTWDTTYGSTSDIHFESGTLLSGSLDNNAEIRSLAISSAGSATNTIDLGGHVLKVSAIGYTSGASATLNIGATANDGTITANGATGGDIYFITSQSNRSPFNFNINSVIADNGGAVNVVFVNGGPFTGSANMTVKGANTYTGKTYINGGVVTMAATASLLTTSEVNIATGASLVTTAAARTFGGGLNNQKIAGGGASAGVANMVGGANSITIGAKGTLAPGDTGANETFYFSFTSGKLAFANDATLALDFGAVAGSDQVSFIGAGGNYLSGGGAGTGTILDITTGAGFGYGIGYTYTVFGNVTTSFDFDIVKLNGTTLSSSQYNWDSTAHTIWFAAIPESSTYAAFAGLAILGVVASRRRRA